VLAEFSILKGPRTTLTENGAAGRETKRALETLPPSISPQRKPGHFRSSRWGGLDARHEQTFDRELCWTSLPSSKASDQHFARRVRARPSLLSVLMRIVLENAGARARLPSCSTVPTGLCPSQAHGEEAGKTIDVLQNLPNPAERRSGPSPLGAVSVHLHGRGRFVIADAASGRTLPLFSPTSVKTAARLYPSAFPILNAGRSVRLFLYLENKPDDRPAFTARERVGLLTLLSGQIAVSIGETPCCTRTSSRRLPSARRSWIREKEGARTIFLHKHPSRRDRRRTEKRHGPRRLRAVTTEPRYSPVHRFRGASPRLSARLASRRSGGVSSTPASTPSMSIRRQAWCREDQDDRRRLHGRRAACQWRNSDASRGRRGRGRPSRCADFIGRTSGG